MPKQFLHIAIGTLLLYVTALLLIVELRAPALCTGLLAVGILVRARRRWPADRDYYEGRNFTRRYPHGS